MRLLVYLASFLFIGHWHCSVVYGLLEGLYCGVENCYDGKLFTLVDQHF